MMLTPNYLHFLDLPLLSMECHFTRTCTIPAQVS